MVSAQDLFMMMRAEAARKLPWCLVVGSLSHPSAGQAVANSRHFTQQLRAEGRVFPIDLVGIYNSWQSRIPMPIEFWARYFGGLMSVADQVVIHSSGAIAHAIAHVLSGRVGIVLDDRRSTKAISETESLVLARYDLVFGVGDGCRNPKPLRYMAGPCSLAPAACTAQAIARGVLVSGECVPIVPHVSHDEDCANPQSYELWMGIDAHLIRKCAEIQRAIGPSTGADAAMLLAQSLEVRTIPNPPMLGGDNSVQCRIADAILHAALPNSSVGL